MENPKNNNLNFRKKVHLQIRANIISKLFFCWTIPFFYKGCKKEITEDDLYGPLPEQESKMLGDKLENEWKKQLKTRKKPSITRAFIRIFGLDYALYGILYLLYGVVIEIAHPLLVGKLMKYYVPYQTEISKNEAYMYAWLIVVALFLQLFLAHHYMLFVQRIGIKIRVSACSLIYRKSLKLSKRAMVETSTGQIVNLLSNDVHRFQRAPAFLHDFWGAPIVTIIVTYLLYTNLGWTSLSGIVVFLLFIPLELYLAKLSAKYRRKTALKTDQRIRLMSEIICGIQVIKMYVWEKPFAKLVNLSRKLEVEQIRKAAYIRAINLAFSTFLSRLGICICVLTYILTGNILQAEYVYVAISYYGILMHSLVRFLPHSFSILAETSVSIQRIEKFLANDEVESKDFETPLHTREEKNGILPLVNVTKKPINGINLKNVSVKWDANSEDNTLSNIDFTVAHNQLVTVVGPVGSGKSTLLQVILNELPLETGVIEVGGTISYASQEPWLFGSTIRQNILFGEEYNAERYKTVIKVCALEHDLNQFDYADQTVVGERGVMLSGGQKARINLARAVYKEADIYLLDDPLSAVDTHVGKQLFDQCISGFLKNKCTVLVTHQLQYLQTVDKIYLLENGRITNTGTFTNLRNNKNEYFKRLDSQPMGSEDENNEPQINKTKAPNLDKLDKPEEVKEHQSKGKISGRIYLAYFKATGHLSVSLFILMLFVLTQILVSGCAWFLSLWMNLEQKRQEDMNILNGTANITESRKHGTRGYIEELTEEYLTPEICMYIYCGLIGSIIFFALARSLSFFKLTSIVSKNLHNNMFAKIVYNSMRFFNTNPSGRILNRFSKDMGLIDEQIPHTIMDTIQSGMVVSGIVAVICSTNIWLIIPTIVICILFYGMRTIFLASSRNLKRIESTSRSPIFTHLSSSLQGLPTIRAFKAQDTLSTEFDNHQNTHSSAFYMFIGANRTFGFWLDLICIAYIATVTVVLLYLGTETYGGSVGLAITQSVSLLGMLQWGVRQWSELENQMTSVERVIEYTELVTESHEETRKPPRDWPLEGHIEFRSVSMQYDINEPMVLKNLTFTIKPREKIGIVGRTGAGKSSLIFALFRLAKIEGSIIIDGVDTKTISLHSLRSKISIIPQEPVLFSGTLRKNLDPFDEYDDDKLWNALQEVELKQVVTDLPLGLQCNISEGGSNFSVGQRQLLCLARAAIRSNKILVLDEATANVDPQTDELIQSTIRRKFADCTVLTIAHRLHTVMDSDKILVMDNGEAAEFDRPYVLLENTGSLFYGLVQQTGKGMAEKLIKRARNIIIDK